ncbi:MAG: TolC family outer membrane protein [Gammaproteobacteria bacterium]|nr:TolC family outer membrane protein [Gammaproteobacteria bacterium]
MSLRMHLSIGLMLLLCSTGSQALDLKEALERAEKYDAALRIAMSDYMAAEEAYPQSRANLLPDLTAGGFYQRNDTTRENSTGAIPDVDSNFTTKGYDITLNQIIFNKTFWDTMEQSKALVAQAAANYEVAKQDLILRTARAYFNVLGAHDNVAFTRAEKEAISRQLEQSRERFNVGLIAITDVRESQASFDNAVANEIVAKNTLRNNIEALRVIIGDPVDDLAPLAETIPLLLPEPADIDQWQNMALDNNLNLKASRFGLTAAKENYQANRGGHYPTLNLSAAHTYDSADGSPFGDAFGGADNTNNNVAVQLAIPLYQGGGVSSRVRQANAQVWSAQAVVDQSVRTTVQQLRDAYLGVEASVSSVEAFHQALISAKTSVEATEAGFEAGTRTSVDVLLVQGRQFEAERNYARSRYDYLLVLLELQQAAGSLNRDDVWQINQWLNPSIKRSTSGTYAP